MMRRIAKWTKSVIVATTNACLLCGAEDVLDWMNYQSKRFMGRMPFTGKRD